MYETNDFEGGTRLAEGVYITCNIALHAFVYTLPCCKLRYFFRFKSPLVPQTFGLSSPVFLIYRRTKQRLLKKLHLQFRLYGMGTEVSEYSLEYQLFARRCPNYLQSVSFCLKLYKLNIQEKFKFQVLFALVINDCKIIVCAEISSRCICINWN